MAEIRIKEQQKEIAIKVAVGVLAIILGLTFIVKPFLEESRSLRSKIDLSRERLRIFDETESIRGKLQKLENFFLMLQERAVVLAKISDTASKEKLDLDSLNPKTEPGEYYTKLLVDVSTKGSFFQLVKFLKNVDSFNPAIKIDAVSITRPSLSLRGKKVGTLQASISLETYLKQRAKKNNGR